MLTPSILVAFLTASASVALAQSPATIRVPVRLVVVPAVVYSGENRLIAGLEAKDFRVFDNGQAQKASVDETSNPLSVAIVVQNNLDVREYLSFIIKAGSVFDALLAGESGETALITYNDEVSIVKPFEGGDLSSALRRVTVTGHKAHMFDAAVRALTLLRQREPSHVRILLLIGQSLDAGSEATLAAVRDAADRDNVTVLTINLPEYGKTFVSDNFSLQGPANAGERGGYIAGVNLGKLISVLNSSGEAASRTDPFSVLTAASGGAQFHVRRQREFESAISAVGVQVRSTYQLSFSPTSSEPGYHTIRVEVGVPNAKVHSRPGYSRAAE